MNEVANLSRPIGIVRATAPRPHYGSCGFTSVCVAGGLGCLTRWANLRNWSGANRLLPR